MPQQQATINFAVGSLKFSFYLNAAETGEKANENIEFFFFYILSSAICIRGKIH